MTTLATHACSRPRAGESVNGDAVLVRRERGRALVAVIDALGHGPVAHAVAQKAVQLLGATPLTVGPASLIEALHAALRGSRGAAATLVVIEDGHLRGCGVGNVEVRTPGAASPIVLSRGVLGGAAIRARAFEARLSAGERFALFTDGITRRLDLRSVRDLPLVTACEDLFARFAQDIDDATLVVGEITS
ncbi:MAG: phosphoserine phosphatase [Sandaracinus sp.]|nr:serine/threonine-protein phosphatase [Sandaracinaceae bacterium]